MTRNHPSTSLYIFLFLNKVVLLHRFRFLYVFFRDLVVVLVNDFRRFCSVWLCCLSSMFWFLSSWCDVYLSLSDSDEHSFVEFESYVF